MIIEIIAPIDTDNINLPETVKKRMMANSVVRCMDCEDSRVLGKTTKHLHCMSFLEGEATEPHAYCYWGKRRKRDD